jgi:hypothetical protein
VTLRLQPQNRLQIIFHRDARVKDSTNFVFDDSTGLLHWITADRASVTVRNAAEIAQHEDPLAGPRRAAPGDRRTRQMTGMLLHSPPPARYSGCGQL